MKASKHQSKSTIAQIRERFDNDVERFSNLETGQVTIIDATLCLDLITSAAYHVNPLAKELLDIGCGAGNYTLKMLERIPDMNCTLIDLSCPMLRKAKERIAPATKGNIEAIQNDILHQELTENSYDIVLAGAVMHHLRNDADWETVFSNIYRALKPGGSFWVSDLISQDHPALEAVFEEQYGKYLENLGGPEYRKKVLDYIEAEDTPRSVSFQLDLMRKVGFSYTEVLHKNSRFAAFGGIR